MATKLASDVINGDRMATKIANGDTKYGDGSIPSPARRHMCDRDKMQSERTRSHLMFCYLFCIFLSLNQSL